VTSRSSPSYLPLRFVGWSFVGTGLYARHRRPEYRFGDLMVVTGFAWFLQALAAANTALVFTLGTVVGALSGAVFIHTLVTFPTGRLETRAQRLVVGFTYVVLFLSQAPLALFSDEEWVTDARATAHASCCSSSATTPPPTWLRSPARRWGLRWSRP
jgi:hypothetical protein